jgi:hypothetical protein
MKRNPQTGSPYLRREADLAEEVKNILIVDPEHGCVGVSGPVTPRTFPQAKKFPWRNGEEALRMIQMAMPCRSRGTGEGV